MNALLEAILTFTNWIWGIPMLILLVGGGCFLAVRLNMLPYRKLPFILTHTIGKSFTKSEGSDGQFSGWQAASGALASTLGAGNMGDSHADSSCRRRVLSCRKTEHAPLSEIAIYSDTHHWKIIHEK